MDLLLPGSDLPGRGPARLAIGREAGGAVSPSISL